MLVLDFSTQKTLGVPKNRNGGFLSNSNINSSDSNGIEEVTMRIDNSELGIYFLLIHCLMLEF